MGRRATASVAAMSVAAALTVAGSAAEVRPAPFSLTERQAQEVGVFAGFVDAFNRRELRRALGYLTIDASVTDCDYRHVRTVQITGKPALTRWLSQRFADRDMLRLGRVYNENADQPTGVLAVDFSRRASNTLRGLGFPDGVKPQLTAKVIFARTAGARIVRFSNGPLGGSAEPCRPE
jgi:hypothetical protein